MVREGQVGEVDVPGRVVQAERAVAPAPGIAGTGKGIDDQRRHTQAAQPRAQYDAALTAAHDQHLWLLRRAEGTMLLLPLLQPASVARDSTVPHAHLAGAAGLFLMALQLQRRSQQRPTPPVLQAQMAAGAQRAGLEAEPGLRGAVLLPRAARLQPEAHGHRTGQDLLQHGADLVRAFQRHDGPGEGQQVAPVALRREERGRAGCVALRHPLRQGPEPSARQGFRRRVHRLRPASALAPRMAAIRGCTFSSGRTVSRLAFSAAKASSVRSCVRRISASVSAAQRNML